MNKLFCLGYLLISMASFSMYFGEDDSYEEDINNNTYTIEDFIHKDEYKKYFEEHLSESNYQANPLFLGSFLTLRTITTIMAIIYWDELPETIDSANILVPPGWWGQIPNLLYGAIGASLCYVGANPIYKGTKSIYNDDGSINLDSLRRVMEGCMLMGAGYFNIINVICKFLQFAVPGGEEIETLSSLALFSAYAVWFFVPTKGLYDFGKAVYYSHLKTKKFNDLNEKTSNLDNEEIIDSIKEIFGKRKTSQYITTANVGGYCVSLAGGFLGVVAKVLNIKWTLILQTIWGAVPNIVTAAQIIHTKIRGKNIEDAIHDLRADEEANAQEEIKRLKRKNPQYCLNKLLEALKGSLKNNDDGLLTLLKEILGYDEVTDNNIGNFLFDLQRWVLL